MPSTLQASIPFLSSIATIWAFSSSASGMASASPLPKLKSARNFAVLRSLSFSVCHANDYALAKRSCCPSDRIECYRNVLRVKQPIQL